MRLYAFYTPSHREMMERHFLPSLEVAGFDGSQSAWLSSDGRIDDLVSDFSYVTKEFPQHSASGAFASNGFQRTCVDKVDFILDAINNEREPFLFSDVDVRFYGSVIEDLTKCLGDAEMAFQWDGKIGKECTGFMVLRPTGAVRLFWQSVRDRMESQASMDQDAAHVAMRLPGHKHLKTIILPERYWTFGRNDKHWTPGMQVNPPADLLVHHANWTIGVDNKMKLLEEVRKEDERRRESVACGFAGYCTPNAAKAADSADASLAEELIKCKPIKLERGVAQDSARVSSALDAAKRGHEGERDPRDQGHGVLYEDPATGLQGRAPMAPITIKTMQGRWLDHEGDEPPLHQRVGQCSAIERMLPYSEVTRMLDEQRRQLTSTRHHPLPLALVLQFWKGDKRRALDLAKLIADLEPSPREDVNDVCFFFARQDNCPMDDEILEAAAYVGQKFPVSHFVATTDPRKKYPGVCYDAWASVVQQISDAYHTGRLPYGNAFFFEADGCPIGSDWIDRLKAAHTETLLLGKRVTGPLMRFGGIDRVHQVGGHVNGSKAINVSCWDDHPSLHRCPPQDAWDVFHGLVLRNEAGPSQIIRNEHGGRGLSEEMYWEFGKESCWIASIKDDTPKHWCRLALQVEQEKRERSAR